MGFGDQGKGFGKEVVRSGEEVVYTDRDRSSEIQGGEKGAVDGDPIHGLEFTDLNG